MITLLIVLASIVTYLGIGVGAARAATPMLARKFIHEWWPYAGSSLLCGHLYCHEGRHEPILERGKIGQTQAAIVAAWPLIVPIGIAYFTLVRPLSRAIDTHDPEVVRAQQGRIRELEAELGIGDRS